MLKFILVIFLYTIMSIDANKVIETFSTNKYEIKSQSNRLKLFENSSQLIDKQDYNKLKNQFKSALLYDNLALDANEFYFNNSFNELILEFGDYKTTWILVNYKNAKNQVFYTEDHVGYKHYDYLENFSEQTQIDKISINPFNKNFIIFTDLNEKMLFITENNGKTLKRYTKMTFKPDEFYFIEDQTNVILSIDRSNKQLWLTINSGKSWNLIGMNINKFSDIIMKNEHNEYIYFIENNDLIRFDLKAFKKDLFNEHVESKRLKVMSNVIDLITRTNQIFIVKKTKIGLKLMSSNNNKDFKEIKFELNKQAKVLEFKVLTETSEDTFIVITYNLNNKIYNDLYQSINSGFTLSLKNIINKCEVQEKWSLSDLNSNKCIELRLLSKFALISNAYDSNNVIQTYIKRSKNDDWTKIEFENNEQDHTIDLNKDLYLVDEQAGGSFANKNLPDFLVGHVNDKFYKESGIYVSNDEANDWMKILNKNYMFSIAFNEDYHINVIIAVESNKPTNKLIYSNDYGFTWNEFYFSDTPVLVEKIIKDSRKDHSTDFLLVCVHKDNQISLIDLRIRTEKSINIDIDQVNSEEEPSPVQEITSTRRVKVNEKLPKKLTESDTFNLQGPDSITDTSFDLKFSILPKPNNLNNYYIRVLEIFKENHHLSYEISYVKNNDLATEKILSEKSFKTNSETLTIKGLKPDSINNEQLHGQKTNFFQYFFFSCFIYK